VAGVEELAIGLHLLHLWALEAGVGFDNFWV
jgi:hypothetical protein